MITQAARMCSDACVCPLDESLHYRLALLQRYGFKGTCLNNLTLLQTSGWWRRAWSLRNHFTPHASKIIIFSCCISYQIFTLYLLQQRNTFTTKLICYGRDKKNFLSYLPIFCVCSCSLSVVTHYLCHWNTHPINLTLTPDNPDDSLFYRDVFRSWTAYRRPVCRSRYKPTAQHQSETPYFRQSLNSNRITQSHPAHPYCHPTKESVFI